MAFLLRAGFPQTLNKALYASNQKIYSSDDFVSKRAELVDWGRKDFSRYTSHLLSEKHKVTFINMDCRTQMVRGFFL